MFKYLRYLIEKQGVYHFRRGLLLLSPSLAHSENKPWLKAFGLVAYASLTGYYLIVDIWYLDKFPFTYNLEVLRFEF